ncbi:ATP-binding cassette domain-containing protein [Enterococcus hulanensis]|nr:ABC transporter ATP-binding protein/permease [Enterococcus hulanensis]MBO0413292.1 ATP-binding cassette domain-containing protein [Enterococcus hulanensis]
MIKLKLENIQKIYSNGENVTALKNVSIGFRENEFVSILGPSGCGKTTLLNIIGGLDHYSSGDLVINGHSTKNYIDRDWDSYRNHSIGFVFQSYNLIGHQTLLQNVEIAMTLSGVSALERKQRAAKALKDVGLEKQLNKKPNQLSGGQMQRVAIARALVNDPDIILADEPTGALDSKTSLQVMEILKNIAKTRLVIMVTHNSELAENYSSRIVRILDGEIQDDNNPLTSSELTDEPYKKTAEKSTAKTSMSMITATTLSFKNLLTKRGRTITTAFAGSIGIIGVALVLALSSGLSNYMSTMQADTLANAPISIQAGEQTLDDNSDDFFGNTNKNTASKNGTDDTIRVAEQTKEKTTHTNVLSKDYLNYIDNLSSELPEAINTITFERNVKMNLLANTEGRVIEFDPTIESETGMNDMMGMSSNSYWQEMPDNDEFIRSQYDFVGTDSRLPSSKNEIAIVVDENNSINKTFYDKLGLKSENTTYELSDFIGHNLLKVIYNDEFYTRDGDLFSKATPAEYTALYNNPEGELLTIVGVLRMKEDLDSGYFSEGFIYTSDLAEAVAENANNSTIAKTQSSSDTNVLTGLPFTDKKMKENANQNLGADISPTNINIYPTDFDQKESIKDYLVNYNNNKSANEQLLFSDSAEMLTDLTGTLVNTISYVLIGFAAISLLVSTIMIGIITYVSVIERTKEIGILRSVGARKKDISRVFNAETLIIGFTAGTLGVVLTYLLSIPINAIVFNLTGITGIAALNPLSAVLLIGGSMVLTLIAGSIPSKMAAKKDPVIALRTE